MKTDELKQAVEKRRTFAIISHPDAGKTTITEQLLLFGGVVRQAGTVKAKKSGNFAKSDWMEIEKKRGISVTSSVMQFDYAGKRVNILDTPGHEDFSEDTELRSVSPLSRCYRRCGYYTLVAHGNMRLVTKECIFHTLVTIL